MKFVVRSSLAFFHSMNHSQRTRTQVDLAQRLPVALLADDAVRDAGPVGGADVQRVALPWCL